MSSAYTHSGSPRSFAEPEGPLAVLHQIASGESTGQWIGERHLPPLRQHVLESLFLRQDASRGLQAGAELGEGTRLAQVLVGTRV